MAQQTNNLKDPASKSKTAMFKPKKLIYETNFDRLKKLGVIGQDNAVLEYGRSQSDGYMDLVIEALPHLDNFKGAGWVAFSMAHYFEHNGDLCQDPEMVIFANVELGMAEVYSFQQALPPLYQEVYPNPDQVYPKLKKSLNSFLGQWLRTLNSQGHGKSWKISN